MTATDDWAQTPAPQGPMGNPASTGPLEKESEHVMAFTHVRRGATPGVWQDSAEEGYAGVWELVPRGGKASRDTGEQVHDFHDGAQPWKQI